MGAALVRCRLHTHIAGSGHLRRLGKRINIMQKVEIYTSATCAYCVAAKNLLKQKGFDYAEIRIDVDPAKRDEMVARTHKRTVPQIFIADRLIGGYDDLVAADRSGELAKLATGAA
jgi:glutaredoxin 3